MDDTFTITLDDLRREEEATARAAAGRHQFFAEQPRGIRLRDIQVSASAASPRSTSGVAGSWFIDRRPPAVQRWYATLFAREPGFSPTDEFAFLISPACQILEKELGTLLIEPAHGVAETLVSALSQDPEDRQPAEALAAWAERRVHATLGTACLLLLALRRARGRGEATVGAFLKEQFQPDFLTALGEKQLGRTLNLILTKYRNPACHGKGSFDAAGYEAFTRLMVASPRFATWDRAGPMLCPPPADAGFLHHLLAGSRQLPSAPLPPAGRALDRLTALAVPRSSSLSIRLEPRHAEEAHVTRDVSVTPTAGSRPFRLGDRVCFAFQSERECYVTLIDVGTSGKVAVVLPNTWHPTTRVPPGVHLLPGPEFTGFDLTLAGRPGRERVFALATVAPLPVSLAPDPNTPFRVLHDADIEALTHALSRLGPAEWAACVCEFKIIGP